MPNTIHAQQALATDKQFRIRVEGALITKALLVRTEGAPGVPAPMADPLNPTPGETAAWDAYYVALNSHNLRQNFAKRVLGGPVTQAELVAPILVMQTNLQAGTTSYDFSQQAVVTTTDDANIASQIATDWDLYASLL